MRDENPYASPQTGWNNRNRRSDATIHVTRTTSCPDRFRAYRILLDGQEIAQLKAGQSMDIPVSAGAHSVVAKIDCCSSPTLVFSIRPGGTVDFECGSNLRGLRMFLVPFYICFLTNRYLTLVQV